MPPREEFRVNWLTCAVERSESEVVTELIGDERDGGLVRLGDDGRARSRAGHADRLAAELLDEQTISGVVVALRPCTC